jgi:hypothetical protein
MERPQKPVAAAIEVFECGVEKRPIFAENKPKADSHLQ